MPLLQKQYKTYTDLENKLESFSSVRSWCIHDNILIVRLINQNTYLYKIIVHGNYMELIEFACFDDDGNIIEQGITGKRNIMFDILKEVYVDGIKYELLMLNENFNVLHCPSKNAISTPIYNKSTDSGTLLHWIANWIQDPNFSEDKPFN